MKRMPWKLAAALAVGLLGPWPVLLAQGSDGETITCPDPEFKLRLLPGLRDYSGKKPDVLYIWEQRDQNDKKTRVFVIIEKAKGELPHGPARQEDLAGKVDKIYTESWQGQQINVYILHPRGNDSGALVTRYAAVPVKGCGIWLQVTGPEPADAQMGMMLKSLLANLEGQTSWAAAEEEATPWKLILPAVGFVLAAVAIVGVVVWRKQQLEQQRRLSGKAAMHAPKGR